MKENLLEQCELYCKNMELVKEAFHHENQLVYPICASIFSAKGVTANPAVMEDCKKRIKEETGLFSYFRGTMRAPLISMFSKTENPEEKIKKAIAIYENFKELFHGSDYLVLVASILTDLIELDESDVYMNRGKKIYKLMKAEHPFLTAGEDSVFAILMAFSEKEDARLLDEMEVCYTFLKRELGLGGNYAQMLSHVITLSSDEVMENCRKVVALYQGLKMQGRKYSKYYEMAVLGALAAQAANPDELVAEILEVDAYLAEQSYYKGLFGIDKKARLMHAAMLVSNTKMLQTKPDTASTAALTSTLAMIAAQEAAMCAAIAATTAATAASTSN